MKLAIKPNVEVIRPVLLQKDVIRTAPYCRVSSKSDDQLHSYAAQIDYYTQSLAQAIARQEGAGDAAELEKKLAALDEDFSRALNTINRTTEDAAAQNREFIRIASEKEAIHERLKAIRLEQEIMTHGSARIKALFDSIAAKTSEITEYDDTLAACIIRQVTVLSKDKIMVKFDTIGIELEMVLDK